MSGRSMEMRILLLVVLTATVMMSLTAATPQDVGATPPSEQDGGGSGGGEASSEDKLRLLDNQDELADLEAGQSSYHPVSPSPLLSGCLRLSFSL